MKVRFLDDTDITHPDLMVMDKTTGEFDPEATGRAVNALIQKAAAGEISGEEFKTRRQIRMSKGQVWSHSLAWAHVHSGVAEPYDAASKQICKAIMKKLDVIQAAQARTARAQLTGSALDASDAQVEASTATRNKRGNGGTIVVPAKATTTRKKATRKKTTRKKATKK
jgi:hypothetical protein